ncbi:MAG: prolyl aminopeptidase [Alphaproteobacteria bacterium]|nr:prolyl aminopeptidase [Alphaproteobacteria bacterium]
MSGDLFPLLEANAIGMLPVDGLHQLYWEESGNRRGVPVVFLHGGPGAGCTPAYRRFFDPAVYRIVLFDQRGAGRSRPAAEVRHNTLRDLIADLESLRRHLAIERWLIFGGSWGSTLALAYGQAHPERCLGFVLRGIFLGARSEVEWFLYRMGAIYPEAARAFRQPIPEAERGDLLEAYHRRLVDPDPLVHMPAARAWSRYEGACSTLRHNPRTVSALTGDTAALALARIEAHYFVNDLFLEPDQLIRDLPRIRHLPCTIVQGRYDIVCPPVTAERLATTWPEAQYTLVEDAGHSAMEPGTRSALVAATERLKARLADAA